MKIIDYIRHKITRSHQHLIELGNSLKALSETRNIEFDYTIDTEKRICHYYIQGLPEIPITTRLLAGEVVTHLRSALDQMIWQLSLNSDPSPPTTTQFPICTNQGEFDKCRTRQINALNPDLQKLVEDMQPFKSEHPKKHPLWVLNRLANDDKHRFITIVAQNATGLGVVFESLPDEASMQVKLGPMKNGSEVAILDFSKSTVNFDLAMAARANPIVMYDYCLRLENDTDLRVAVHTLYSLGIEVENIVKKFEPFFADRSYDFDSVSSNGEDFISLDRYGSAA